MHRVCRKRAETYLPVVGYAGRYEISNTGVVLSLVSRHGVRPKPRELSASENLGGYLFVYLSDGFSRKMHTVHSLVAEAFLGPRPTNHVVNHVDGNKTNNSLWNLEYCSYSENNKHAHRIGLASSVGVRHSRARLTDTLVREIRSYRDQGCKIGDICTFLKLPSTTVHNVFYNGAWRHVQ